MWFATRDGLNRYDGNAFVVYKNNPNDPDSLSSNFIQDLIEDDNGYLRISTNTGVNRFDPATERCKRYLHDVNDADGISRRLRHEHRPRQWGYLWFGTLDSGVNRFDPKSGRFAHYRNDSNRKFVGRVTKLIAGRQGEIWFVGERGLFHFEPTDRRITRPPAIPHGLTAESVYEDEAGNLWMLADFPIVGLVNMIRRQKRTAEYALPAVPASTAYGGSTNGKLIADGRNGLWVPSGLGLSYFDRRTEKFTYRLEPDETDPDTLDSNADSLRVSC